MGGFLRDRELGQLPAVARMKVCLLVNVSSYAPIMGFYSRFAKVSAL